MPSAPSNRRFFTTRQLAFGAILLLGLGLLGGWLVHAYLEHQRIIKTDTEPAAQLKRDDTAKTKAPKLFITTREGISYASPYEDDPRTHFYIDLLIDEKKCKDYYGDDGVMQCESLWNTLEPARAQTKISPSIDGAEWNFSYQHNSYERFFSFRYFYDQEASQSNQTYTITLPQDLGENVVVSSKNIKITTPAFEPEIEQWSFRADPENPQKSLLSGKIVFGWAVDESSLPKHLTLTTRSAAEKKSGDKTGANTVAADTKPSSTEASATPPSGLPTVLAEPVLTLSPDGRKVGLVAEVLKLPPKSELATLALTPGIVRKHQKATSQKTVQQATTVPGQDVFVSLTDVRSFTATDNENLQKQVLLMEFTRPVNVAEVQAATQGILLPRFENEEAKKDNNPTNWQQYIETSAAFTTALERSANRPLPLEPIESAEEYSTTVSFNYQIPAGYRNDSLGHPHYFHLTNPGGMGSSAGYPLAAFAKTVPVAALEKELYIMQKGAILSLNASKTLALFSRGLNKVNLNAWQVRPQFINLLVTQSYGDLDSLEISSHTMGFSHLSEKKNFSYTPSQSNENTPNYTAFDLSPLLADGNKGLFHLELQGAGINEEGKQESLQTYQTTFLLVTDLAMNIKQASNGTREVFIHSFATGKPSAGVKVEVVGQNGLPLFGSTTNEQGNVSIPDVSGFNQEKSPVAIVATLGDDYTFMPIHSYKRAVSYMHIPSTAGRHVREGGISAFTFAERGIFRPGEELRFGALIKNAAWENQSLEGLPLRIRLYNPRSDVVYDKLHTHDSSGLVSVAIPTKETDPTGQYTLEVRLDDKWLGGTSVQVEEFQPDTIKVETRFNKVPKTGHKGWVVPDNLKLMATVSNLYGTPAAGNKVNFSYSLTPTQLHFKEFDEYRFFDPGKANRRYASEKQSAETNPQGEAEFTINFDGYASGSYFLHAITEAFETGGGRGVTRSNTLLVSPHTVMVGWKSDLKMSYISQNSKAHVHFLAIDNTLVPASLDNLEVTVSEVQHISSLVKTDSGSYRYDTARRLTKVSTTPVSIETQGLNFALPTNTTGEFEVSLKDSSGLERCNLTYVIAGASQRLYGLERDATLRVHLDKFEYEAGETMEIFISAPYAGAGLITLESDKVLASQWFSADTSDSVQRITVPSTIEGRAFVNVALVRDIYSDAVYSSPFTYAVTPFMANLERRDQKLRLEAPEKAAPGDTLTMRVSAQKPGKAIVFAVDEGILQLTNYNTPSTLSYFLKQTPLSVATMQNWSLIMPEYNIFHSSFGGDLLAQPAEASAYLNPFRRKAEASVVYWSGVIDVASEGTELTWQVPSYFNGSLRLMAVSAGEGSIGEAVQSTTVKGPLIISPSLPVAVAPGDEFDVTVAIANNIEGSGDALEVALSAEITQGLAFVQEPEKNLAIGEEQQGKMQFRLKATEKLGEAILTLTAKAMNNGKEVTVKRPTSLSVRPASPKVTAFSAGFIKNKDQTIPVGRNLYPEFGAIEASVSGLPLPLIDGLASFLTTFPHSCTEQVLSAAFPYIALNKSSELLPVPHGETPLEVKNRSEKAFQKGLATLREREITPGRFTLWPYEESRGYNFLTVFGLDYLISAQEAGFKVPQDLIENTRLQTLRIIQSTPTDQEAMRVTAYAAWVYTRSGKTLTELPRLVKDLDANIKDWRKTPSAALIAASYAMMQQSDKAKQLINSAKAIAPEDKTNRNYPGWFTSRLWDNSLLLTVYASSFPEKLADKEAEKALVYVINDVSSSLYTTSSAAQAVRALADYAMANMGQSPELGLVALDSKQNVLAEEATGTAVKRLTTGNEAHAFRFSGAKDLYWHISSNGFDKTPLKPLAKKIMVTSEYIPVDDKPLGDLAQGDEVYVLIRAKSAQASGSGRHDKAGDRIDNVAITSLLPGGFEMVITKGGALIGGSGPDDAYRPGAPLGADLEPDGPKPHQNYEQIAAVRGILEEAGIDGHPLPIVHAERREDRMVVFTSLTSQERLFIYRIKAINKGKFTLPATSAAAVYDPDARANTEEGVIEVK